jgi:hypothetical protein
MAFLLCMNKVSHCATTREIYWNKSALIRNHRWKYRFGYIHRVPDTQKIDRHKPMLDFFPSSKNHLSVDTWTSMFLPLVLLLLHHLDNMLILLFAQFIFILRWWIVAQIFILHKQMHNSTNGWQFIIVSVDNKKLNITFPTIHRIPLGGWSGFVCCWRWQGQGRRWAARGRGWVGGATGSGETGKG